MIKVLIADDHEVIVEGLKALLNTSKELEILGHAGNGLKVMEFLRSNKVDVILLDINMPEMDGMETTKAIRNNYPDVKILILSMYNKAEFIRNLVELGAHGYVLKNTPHEELVAAIKKVHSGQEHFSTEVQTTIEESLKANGKTGPAYLTDRERDIIKLLAEGNTTSEIAKKLYLSTHTVDTHRKNLMAKLGQKNIASLVRFAVENGYAGEQF